jgi:F-type H+-transporting ATPase subunit O
MLGRSAIVARRSVAAAVQKRGLSAAAASEKKEEVDLPIQLYGLEARYANALYVAAVRAKTLPAVEDDLKTISQWAESNAAWKNYLSNPIISRTDKVADMAKVSQGMNDTTRGFLNVLAENGRLVEVNKIIKSFNTILNAKRGIVDATVTAAEELSAKQLKTITSAITTGYLEKGQQLKMEVQIDPSIIGGLQVQIGDKFLDLSVNSDIKNLHKVLA